MRFISWNVNGLRACMQKGFPEVFDTLNADFFCLQETKLQEGQIALNLPGYEQYWCYAEKKGYSGTAIFTKHTPLSVAYGMGIPELDTEGRLITLEYKEFYLVTCYTPNAQRGLARIDHRLKWEDAFRGYLMDLDSKKPVILCGDLNVAHQEIDLKNPGSNRGNAGFSDEERGCFTKLLESGFTDTFRYLHPDATGAYTWWSYMFNARQNNAGWRIDYFLVSDRLKEQIFSTPIYPEILGSDHCPVGLDLDICCNGSIWSSFENTTKPSPKEEDKSSKSSGVKAAAAVLSAALVLLVAIIAFPRQSALPDTPSTGSTVSDTGAGQIQTLPFGPLFSCTVHSSELTQTGFSHPAISSTIRYIGFYDGTSFYRTDPISSAPHDLACGFNFWIRVVPYSTEALQDSSLSIEYESLVQHAAVTDMRVTKYYSQDMQWQGWLVYGYVPRDGYVHVDLLDKDGFILDSQAVHIWPVLTADDAQFMTTAELVDFALHLEPLLYGFASSDSNYNMYTAIWDDFPALTELIFRDDLVSEIEAHSRSYPNCTSSSQELLEIAKLHAGKYAQYGTYLSRAEAEALSTEELVSYLSQHQGFTSYISAHWQEAENIYSLYENAKYFNPVLAVLEERTDATEVLLSGFNDDLTTHFLMLQHVYMSQLSIPQAQQVLDALCEGNDISTISTKNLAMVITNVYDIYTSLMLGNPYPYETLLQEFPPLKELENRVDAVTILLLYLTDTTNAVSTAQKDSASAILYKSACYDRMTQVEKELLDQYGLRYPLFEYPVILPVGP